MLFFAPRDGRGERGGCDLLKGRLIKWVHPRFFFAGTALDPKVKVKVPFFLSSGDGGGGGGRHHSRRHGRGPSDLAQTKQQPHLALLPKKPRAGCAHASSDVPGQCDHDMSRGARDTSPSCGGG